MNSPEQMNSYIKVANPGVWLILASIIVLLGSAIVWGIFGTIVSEMPVAAISDETGVYCYIPADEIEKISRGKKVVSGEAEGVVSAIAKTPIQADETFDGYVFYIGEFGEGDFCYRAELDISLPEGVYSAAVELEKIHPIQFIIQ